MNKTLETLRDKYEYNDDLKYYKITFGDKKQYELAFEPLIFGGMYIALYEDQELIAEKVQVSLVE